jgi:hypothetical protein
VDKKVVRFGERHPSTALALLASLRITQRARPSTAALRAFAQDDKNYVEKPSSDEPLAAEAEVYVEIRKALI